MIQENLPADEQGPLTVAEYITAHIAHDAVVLQGKKADYAESMEHQLKGCFKPVEVIDQGLYGKVYLWSIKDLQEADQIVAEMPDDDEDEA